MKKINYYKILPFIPILGIILTPIFHFKKRNTGIEKIHINIISALFQAISIIIVFL